MDDNAPNRISESDVALSAHLSELLSLIGEVSAQETLIKEHQEKLRSLKSNFKSIPFGIAEAVSGCSETAKSWVLFQLYFGFDDVPVQSIIEAFGLRDAAELKKRIGDDIFEHACEGCGGDITYSTRAQRSELIRKDKGERTAAPGKFDQSSLVCKQCAKRLSDHVNAQIDERRTQQERRNSELREMPYREYLMTPEWQETRSDALRRAYYRCQVCNTNKSILDVHHRTYARRGNEWSKDLIVLCRDCHSTFHKQGKLAQ